MNKIERLEILVDQLTTKVNYQHEKNMNEITKLDTFSDDLHRIGREIKELNIGIDALKKQQYSHELLLDILHTTIKFKHEADKTLLNYIEVMNSLDSADCRPPPREPKK